MSGVFSMDRQSRLADFILGGHDCPEAVTWLQMHANSATLVVYDNVVFRDNVARQSGGAVHPPLIDR